MSLQCCCTTVTKTLSYELTVASQETEWRRFRNRMEGARNTGVATVLGFSAKKKKKSHLK